MSIEVTGHYQVDPHQAFSFANEPGFILLGDGAPDLINGGAIRLKVSHDDTSVAAVQASAANATIDNQVGGEISVLNARGDSQPNAILIDGDGATLTNAGLISALSRNAAVAVAVMAQGQDLDFLNTGRIQATGVGQFGQTSTVEAIIGGAFENRGEIVARSQISVALTALAGSSVDAHLVNSGLIRAVGGEQGIAFDASGAGAGLRIDNTGSIIRVNPQSGPGLAIYLPSEGSGTIEINNSGLVRGWIFCPASDVFAGAVHLTNSNAILGDIVLALGDDTVVNTGTIKGGIYLGGGDDRYDGTGGVTTSSVIGGPGADVLIGGKGADAFLGDDGFDGPGGADRLEGGRGDDQLFGGAMTDTLIGGAGSDTMGGGVGGDRFVYLSVADSHGAGADLIIDLDNHDLIDLSAIDADTTVAGDQAFHVVDRFTGHAGELTFSFDPDAPRTVIHADVDGDGKADLAIRIDGDHTDFNGLVL